MKHISILVIISFSQNVSADFRFTYNNHTYDVVTTLQTWKEASIESRLKSVNNKKGYLVHINDALEDQKISAELEINLPQQLLEQTNTFDAGLSGIPALWIGANDIDSEGVWKWVDDDTQFWEGDTNGSSVSSRYNNWGDVDGGAPLNYTGDDSDGQDAAVLRLTDWIFGKKSQWDDVSIDNSLFYVVEYDSVEDQNSTPYYQNGILTLPNVFVADANNCYVNYMAKLKLLSTKDTLSFTLSEASLLATLSTCNLNVKAQPSYKSGILNLPQVNVSDGLNNFIPYEVELSLTPFSNPLQFQLDKATKLTTPEPIDDPVDEQPVADFSIISNCTPAKELPCTVTVQDKSIGLTDDAVNSYWSFSDTPSSSAATKIGRPYSHQFTTAGTHKITYGVGDAGGNTIHELTKDIIVSTDFWMLPKDCSIEPSHIGDFWYTCEFLGDDPEDPEFKAIYKLERFDEDFNNKRVKLVFNADQCGTAYLLTSTDFPQMLKGDDDASYIVNKCGNTTKYTYVQYRYTGIGEFSRIRTEHQFTENPVHPITTYKEGIDKQGIRVKDTTASSGLENGKPFWLVEVKDFSLNTEKIDLLLPVRQSSNEGYIYQCDFNNAIPIYQNITDKNQCAEDVQKRYNDTFKPLPNNIPLW